MEWVEQPWMSEETNPHWQQFIALSPESREAALKHTLRTWHSYDMAGWQDVKVTLDDETGYYHISTWIGGDYRKFVDEVEELNPTEELIYGWAMEPGSYNWELSRRYDLIYVAPPGLSGAIMRWDELLDALDLDRIIEEKFWWGNWGENARFRNEGDGEWVGYLLNYVKCPHREFEDYDWSVSIQRTPAGVGWHGEAWESLRIEIGPVVSYYIDAGIDQLAEEVARLAPDGGMAQIWGLSRPWAHGWFLERQGSFVTLESPLLEGCYGEWTVCYEDLRQAFFGGESNGEEVRSAVRDWVRFDTLVEPLLGENTNEFWHAYDARSAESRELSLDRFCVADVTLSSLEGGQGDSGLVRLSFRLEDSMRLELQEDLWMRVLSAETADEMIESLESYEQYLLSEDPSFWLDAPGTKLAALLGEIQRLEDGGTLLIGGDDGIVPRCPDGREQLVSHDSYPTHHRWIVARHGEVMLIDSTLLSSEFYVSRASLLTALAQQ